MSPACSDRVMATAGLDVGLCTEAHSVVRPVAKAHYAFLCHSEDVALSCSVPLPLSLSVCGDYVGRNALFSPFPTPLSESGRNI